MPPHNPFSLPPLLPVTSTSQPPPALFILSTSLIPPEIPSTPTCSRTTPTFSPNMPRIRNQPSNQPSHQSNRNQSNHIQHSQIPPPRNRRQSCRRSTERPPPWPASECWTASRPRPPRIWTTSRSGRDGTPSRGSRPARASQGRLTIARV